MNQYLIRFDQTLENYSLLKSQLSKYHCTLNAAVFELGKRGDNPHYHVLISCKYKDSYLRKNFLSIDYPKKYSLKEYNKDLKIRTQQYFSKLENNGDKLLLSDWDIKKANEAYWKENDKLKSKCNTISDKLLYHYQTKFTPPSDQMITEILDKINMYRHETNTFDQCISHEELLIYYSNLEYFRTNSKLIPLDYDMKKYIRTVQLKLRTNMSEIYDYYNDLAMPFFQNFK